MYETVTFHDARWFNTEDLLNEEWRDIPNYVGVYQVSNYGRIKRLEHTKVYKNNAHYHYTPLIIKPQFDRWGYMQIHLCRHQEHKWIKIHRLVAEAFLPNPCNLPQVNHIDGDKANPRLDNLEWVTQRENTLHAYKTGLIKNFKKTPILQFDLDGNFVQEFESITYAAKAIKRNPSSIHSYLKGRTTHCGGYMWKRKENA